MPKKTASRKKSEIDINRLCMAMQRSSRSMERFRTNRREAVRQYVGHHYSENGSEKTVPVNLIGVYASVVGRTLISKAPRFLLTTFQKSSRPSVAAMQDWVNKEVEESDFAGTMQQCVMDSLFSIGIAKVALAKPGDELMEGAYDLVPGVPFCDRVDLDDFLFDVHARTWREVSFIGHRYRVPLDSIRDSKVYSQSRKLLQASVDPAFNQQGDERISMILRGYNNQNTEEFEDMVDLWEIYLPRMKRVITLPDIAVAPSGVEGGIGWDEPLLDQEWVGPACGPYHILGMGIVPANAMPKAPIMDIIDLHDAANRSYRKVIRTVDRVKENTFVSGSASEDGSRLMEADDGEILKVDNPERIKQVVTGGQALPNLWLMANGLRDLVSFVGGNLELLGGRSPQSKTAKQDEMLNQNAGAGVNDLQEFAIKFVSQVGKAYCWYWWHDPFKVMHVPFSPDGLPEIQTVRKIAPQDRMARFADLDIRVDPYSMTTKTPEIRMTNLDQIVQQVIIPMMATPMWQASGLSFDLQAYLSLASKYRDMPELSDLISIQEPMQGAEQPQGGGEAQPGQPQETTRNYVRENVPQRSRQGDERNMMNALQGINPGGGPETAGQ